MKETYNIITPLVIYLLIPLAGVIYYLTLNKRMKVQKITDPPMIAMFIIFFTYGGLLTLILTSFFGGWSGMASLGMFYLIFLAPIAMIIIGVASHKKRDLSIYHRRMYNFSSLYFLIAPVAFFILFHYAKN